MKPELFTEMKAVLASCGVDLADERNAAMCLIYQGYRAYEVRMFLEAIEAKAQEIEPCAA
jgi:hypothetical protein